MTFTTYTDGYKQAVAISELRSNGDGTYMYDSSRRIREVARLDPYYEDNNDEYKRGFAAGIYSLFRC